MENMIVDVRLSIDLPHHAIEDIVGRRDDGTDRWIDEAVDAVQVRMREEFHEYLDYASGEPDVDLS